MFDVVLFSIIPLLQDPFSNISRADCLNTGRLESPNCQIANLDEAPNVAFEFETFEPLFIL